MRETYEVWERRPGGRWHSVHSGTRDSGMQLVRRAIARGRGWRFAPPVQFTVLPVGDFPEWDTEPWESLT